MDGGSDVVFLLYEIRLDRNGIPPNKPPSLQCLRTPPQLSAECVSSSPCCTQLAVLIPTEDFLEQAKACSNFIS